MRKSPRWGWRQLIRALGKGAFSEDWKIIRLNLNLFEYKSPLTAGKGSSSPASFGQEGSKRNCETALSAVSGLGRGSEKEIAMWELSISITQNNSKGQVTNSMQSVDKPPPSQHPTLGFRSISPPFSKGRDGRHGPFPRGVRRAWTAPLGAAEGGKSAVRGLRLAGAHPGPEPAGPGRPRAFPHPGWPFRSDRWLRRPRPARELRALGAEGRRGETAGRRGDGRCILGNPPTWGEAAAAAVSPGRRCRRFPDVRWGLAARRGPGVPGTDRPARSLAVRPAGPCEGAAPSATAFSSSSSPAPSRPPHTGP